MNKLLLSEGRRFTELANEGIWEDYVAYHSPETMLKIYSLIDEMRVALEFYAVRDSTLPIEISPARAVLQKLEGGK